MQNLLVKTKELLVKNKWLIAVLLVATLLPLVVLAGDSIGDSVQEAVVSLLKPILYYLGNILIFLINLITFLFEYNDFLNVPVVNQGWIVVRDLINMTFVLFMMVMALGTILPFGMLATYNYKSFMVKLLIAAIVINFSKTILGVIIDACQIVMLQFVSSFREAIAINLADGAMLPQLLEFSANTDTSMQATIISMIAGIVFLVIFIFVILVYALVLLYRIISLWIILMLSPLMFFSQVGGPLLGGIGKELWSKFWKQVTVGITLAFFMWLALTIMYMTDTPQAWMTGNGGEQVGADLKEQSDALNKETNASDKNICSSKACEYYNILRFIIAIVVLMQALEQAQKAGGFASKWAGKITAGLAAAATYKGLKSYYNSAKKKKDSVANSKVGKYTTERAKMMGNSMLGLVTKNDTAQGVIKKALKGAMVGGAAGGVFGAGAGLAAGAMVGGFGLAKIGYKKFTGSRAKKREEKQDLVKETRKAKTTETKMKESLDNEAVKEVYKGIDGKTFNKSTGTYLTKEGLERVEKIENTKQKMVIEPMLENDKKIVALDDKYKTKIDNVKNDNTIEDGQKQHEIEFLEQQKSDELKRLNNKKAEIDAFANKYDDNIKEIANDKDVSFDAKISDEAKENIGDLMYDSDKKVTNDLSKMAYMFREDLGAYVARDSLNKAPENITKDDLLMDAGGKTAITPLVEINRDGKRYRQKIGKDKFYAVNDNGVYKHVKGQNEETGEDVYALTSNSVKFEDDMGVMGSKHQLAMSAAGFAMGSAKDKEMQEKSKKYSELDDESLKTLVFRSNMNGGQKEAAMYNLFKRDKVAENLNDDEKKLLKDQSKDSPMLTKMVTNMFKDSHDTRQFEDANGQIDYKKMEEAIKKGQLDAAKMGAGQINPAFIETLIRAKGKGAGADLENMMKNQGIKASTVAALDRYLTLSLRGMMTKGASVNKDGGLAAYTIANGSLVQAIEKLMGKKVGESTESDSQMTKLMVDFFKANPKKTDAAKSFGAADWNNPLIRKALEKNNDVTIINQVLRSDDVTSETKAKVVEAVDSMGDEFVKRVAGANKDFAFRLKPTTNSKSKSNNKPRRK